MLRIINLLDVVLLVWGISASRQQQNRSMINERAYTFDMFRINVRR